VSEWRLARRETLDGDELAWDVFGDGPPIVLVHGTPSWSYLWRDVAPVLAERSRVYVLDQLGYGDSPAAPGADLSLAAHGRRLARLLDRWSLSDPVLVGHDIGGAVVLRAHLLEGRPARGIALVDAVALAPWITPTTRHIRSHLEAYRTMPAHIYEHVVGAHIATAVARPLREEARAAYLRPWQGQQGQAAYFEKIAQFSEEDTAALSERYADLRVPVRLVWGEEDRWLDLGVAHRLRDAIPDAELVTIPGAGHFAPEDEPRPVAAALAAFAGRLR